MPSHVIKFETTLGNMPIQCVEFQPDDLARVPDQLARITKQVIAIHTANGDLEWLVDTIEEMADYTRDGLTSPVGLTSPTGLTSPKGQKSNAAAMIEEMQAMFTPGFRDLLAKYDLLP